MRLLEPFRIVERLSVAYVAHSIKRNPDVENVHVVKMSQCLRLIFFRACTEATYYKFPNYLTEPEL